MNRIDDKVGIVEASNLRFRGPLRGLLYEMRTLVFCLQCVSQETGPRFWQLFGLASFERTVIPGHVPSLFQYRKDQSYPVT